MFELKQFLEFVYVHCNVRVLLRLGMSAVQIESACLERLLEALDTRHLSGWYHPAMRLQAQLNVVEGNNAALREQLRAIRYLKFCLLKFTFST